MRWRAQVAAELEDSWPKRAAAMAECQRAGVRMKCGACGHFSLFPARCAARTCPDCARRSAAIARDKVQARLGQHDVRQGFQRWEGPGERQRRSWKLLTLTLPSVEDKAARWNPTDLRNRLQLVRAAWRGFWSTTEWGRQRYLPGAKGKRNRRDTSYIIGLEVSPAGMVHLHAAIFGEFIAQPTLRALWRRALEAAGFAVGPALVVDIRQVQPKRIGATVEAALLETIKYATKGEKDAGSATAITAAAVELAMRGIRRVEVGGALRRVTLKEIEASALDLLDIEREPCKHCGTLGIWRYDGSATPASVLRNRGFGPLLTGPP